MALTIATHPEKPVINDPTFEVTTSLTEGSTYNNLRIRAEVYMGGRSGKIATIEQPKGLNTWEFKKLLDRFVRMPDFAIGGNKVTKKPTLGSELLTGWDEEGNFTTFTTSGREITVADGAGMINAHAASNDLGSVSEGDILIIGFENYADTGTDPVQLTVGEYGDGSDLQEAKYYGQTANKITLARIAENLTSCYVVLGNVDGDIYLSTKVTIKKITDFINDPSIYFKIKFTEYYENSSGVTTSGSSSWSDTLLYIPAIIPNGQSFDSNYLLKNGDGIYPWYLPSQDELNQMYVNLHLNGLGGFSTSQVYWSSSESSATNAWNQYFLDGTQTNYAKSAVRNIRPIRRFTDISGAYALGDKGPSGGWIFYIDDIMGTIYYYEAAPADITPAAWSNITATAIGITSTSMGSGIINTERIIDQSGHTASAALDSVNYVFNDINKFLNKGIRNGEKLSINGSHEMRVLFATDETYINAWDSDGGFNGAENNPGYGYIVINSTTIGAATSTWQFAIYAVRDSVNGQISEELNLQIDNKCFTDSRVLLYKGDMGTETMFFAGQSDKRHIVDRETYRNTNYEPRTINTQRRTIEKLRTGYQVQELRDLLKELISSELVVWMIDENLTDKYREIAVTSKEVVAKSKDDLIQSEIDIEYYE